jgi:hypothetical protein
MAKRHVYSKDITGFGEFIYIDLLPNVRRSRSFNVNVVSALLLAIVLAFFLIYQPYRDGTFQLESEIQRNYDLLHELELTEEEFDGYEIDLSAIDFEQDIENIEQLQIDFNTWMLDIEQLVPTNGVRSVDYNAVTQTIIIEIAVINEFRIDSINTDILKLDWVQSTSYTTPSRTGDNIEFISTFTIGVIYDAE